MEQQTKIPSGNIVFKTMLEDLANSKNGSKLARNEQNADQQLENKGESISMPFKKTVPAQQGAISKKIDERKALKIVVLLFVGMLLITGGKFGYDWVMSTFFKKEVVVVPSIPIDQSPLFDIESSVKIFLQEGADLKSELIKKSDDLYQAGIVQFVVYKDGVNYLSLDDLSETLEIQIPEAVKASLGQEYMLYVSVDSDNMDSRYRLNLALLVDDAESLPNSLLSWEFSMQKDLANFHLKMVMEEPASAEFLDNAYESAAGEIIPIRYLNVNDIYTTFDYALVKSEKYLLINTTKEAIFNSLAIIDRMISEEEMLMLNEEMENAVESAEEATTTEEEESIEQSRQVLNSFAQALIVNDTAALESVIIEDKKASIIEYLASLEAEKRIELGNKLQTEAVAVYEKSDSALYSVDCSFLDISKQCSFYLETVNGEWKIIQL